MSTWKADMDVRSGLKEWDLAQNCAQCSSWYQRCFNFGLQ